MADTPIVDADVGPHNGVLKFFSAGELQQFEERERKFWEWLQTNPVRNQMRSLGDVVSQNLGQIRNLAQQLGDGSDKTRVSETVTALQQAFRNVRIPVSTSPIGEFIADLKSESQTVAAAALAIWMNITVDMSKFEHVKGAILMAAFDARITTKSPAAVKRSLQTLQQRYQEAKAATEEETSEQRREFAEEKSRHRRTLARMLRQGRRRLKAFRDDKESQTVAVLQNVADEFAAARSSFQDTENLYREQMGLKAPVEYWSSKAKVHREKTESYRKILIWFSAVSGTALLVGLYRIADHAISVATADKPSTVYLVLVTLGVVLTTIVFWAARIITRLFLSEHHLAIDAEERAVMAQTYLALTAEKQATDQERAIVLGSLFRPTADGIVKDDAAPDLSPASLLSRLGSK
jgi:hypothetical protein